MARIYVVESGDNVDSIALKEGINVNRIILDNQLIYPYELAVGQALFISEETDRNNEIDGNGETGGIGEGGGETTGSGVAGRRISVNGYAYPFISPWVLSQTLPYLSELSVFSYGFTAEGELLSPILDDARLSAAAEREGVLPVLTLTPFGEEGRFNNGLINSVVNDAGYTENLIQNLLQTMGEKGYRGLNIDFEYILAQDRDAFTAFVERTAEVMRANGYQTSVALAPKTSADQPGLLYAGKDYGALGAAADYVLLMTYEWGYTYGPPMAVAPIDKVRQVVEYALTEIPAYKIDLGIPNYGYDWPLPFERGVTKALTIGNVEAVRIAIANGATIRFDETAMSPYFQYYDNETGIVHEVWFEDVRSMQARFDLIKEYGLKGCGYWTVMQWFRANWLLLADNFQIERT